MYIGYTENLRQRFRAHNAGKVFSTRPYIPYRLIFYEAYASMKDAKRREQYLKTAKGRMTIHTILKDTLG